MPCPHSGANFTTLRVLDRPLEFAELMINMYLITPMPRAISEEASWPSSPRQAMSPAWPIKSHAHNPSAQFAPVYREWPSQWQIQFLNISNTLLPRSVRSILTEASTRHGDKKGIRKWPKQTSVSLNFNFCLTQIQGGFSISEEMWLTILEWSSLALGAKIISWQCEDEGDRELPSMSLL